MSGLVGEFECKLDSKGRFLFPAGLRKQLDPAANEVFMMNKGFEVIEGFACTTFALPFRV
jgi:MraZ protein